jgi:hypothetical protein
LPAFSVRIINPAQTGVPMTFNIGSQSFTLAPGTQQDLTVGAGSVVQFTRGPGLALATYSLVPGAFTFTATPGGVDLFQAALPSAPAATIVAMPQGPPTLSITTPSGPPSTGNMATPNGPPSPIGAAPNGPPSNPSLATPGAGTVR